MIKENSANFGREKNKATLADVEREATLLKSHLLALGANDYEFPSIDGIVLKVKAGEITPQKALELFTKIKESKQER